MRAINSCCFEFSGSLDSYPKTVYKSSSSPPPIAQPTQRLSNLHMLGVALSTYRDFSGTRGRNDDEEFSITC